MLVSSSNTLVSLQKQPLNRDFFSVARMVIVRREMTIHQPPFPVPKLGQDRIAWNYLQIGKIVPPSVRYIIVKLLFLCT